MDLKVLRSLFKDVTDAIQHCVIEGYRDEDDYVCIDEDYPSKSLSKLMDFLYENLINNGEINETAVDEINEEFDNIRVYPEETQGSNWTSACFEFVFDGEKYRIYFG